MVREIEERRARLKKALEREAFVPSTTTPHVTRRGAVRTEGWLFDIRSILSRADTLEDIASIFWHQFSDAETQVGTIETAGIPLMTALVIHGKTYGRQKNPTGFYIRKSRKRTGLLKMVEGKIMPDKRIVLVDDLANNGRGLMRQVEVVESLGWKVSGIWVLIRFRDPDFYQYFREKGIPLHAVFDLNDFADTLGTKNIQKEKDLPPRQDFRLVWKFSASNPSFQHVVPKSNPALDEERLYVGSDSAVFFALSQRDGSIVWSRKVGFHAGGKGIFSSPALYDGTVYFGAYDGNVYALDALTGATRWIFFDADWVGSSPALASDLGLLFIGLEFGLWRKRGGIAALDLRAGKKRWSFIEMPCLTHSTPLYIKNHRQVAIGSNDGAVYLFDAATGVLVWKFEIAPLSKKERDTGFSSRDIKASLAYDEKRDMLIFGNTRGEAIALNRRDGSERHRFVAEFGFFSSPVIFKDTVLLSSLDKNLYCLDLDTFTEKWRWSAGARIFATPVIIEESIYQGANTGILTELDPENGSARSMFLVPERITNKVAYNPKTKRFFLPTFANDIYCLERILRNDR